MKAHEIATDILGGIAKMLVWCVQMALIFIGLGTFAALAFKLAQLGWTTVMEVLS